MNDKKETTSGALSEYAGVGRCSVTCPMCGHAQTQYRLNPRMYWNNHMDLDLKPSGFQCLKGVEGLYPPLYDLWHCPQCHFTAHNRTFPDPLKHVFIEKGFVQRHFREASRSGTAFAQVCEVLGAHQDLETLDFATAIRRALLAVYFDMFIVGLLRQGYSSAARGSLRLAWLYRDWASMDEAYDTNREAFQAKMDVLAESWPEMPCTEHAALRHACSQYASALQEAAVQNDPVERATILMHVARICLQMDDTETAVQHLAEFRSIAIEEQNRMTEELRADDRERSMSEEERGKLVSARRRLTKMVDDGADLQADIRRLQAAAKPAGTPVQAKGARSRKKGLFRGLFGG